MQPTTTAAAAAAAAASLTASDAADAAGAAVADGWWLPPTMPDGGPVLIRCQRHVKLHKQVHESSRTAPNACMNE